MSVKNLASSSLTVPDFPVGGLMMWGVIAGGAPRGWLRCDGSSYNTSDYPELFQVIGYSFGGSGSSFNVPNQIYSSDGVTLIGWESSGSPVGTVVGENNVTLTAAQGNQPSVNHTHASTVTGTEHTHTLLDSPPGGAAGSGSGRSSRSYITNTSLTTMNPVITSSSYTLTNVQNSGQNAVEAHTNIQPSTGVEYIIRAYTV